MVGVTGIPMRLNITTMVLVHAMEPLSFTGQMVDRGGPDVSNVGKRIGIPNDSQFGGNYE